MGLISAENAAEFVIGLALELGLDGALAAFAHSVSDVRSKGIAAHPAHGLAPGANTLPLEPDADRGDAGLEGAPGRAREGVGERATENQKDGDQGDHEGERARLGVVLGFSRRAGTATPYHGSRARVGRAPG